MAEYDPPIYDVSVFNPAYFFNEDGITEAYLSANYLKFPLGQGLETLPDLRINNPQIHLGQFTSTGDQSVAIGNAAICGGDRGVAVGKGIVSFGDDCVAIGNGCGTGFANKSIAIGFSANSSGSESIAIGDAATTSTATKSIAIGNSATSSGTESIAIGDVASTSTAIRSIAIGNSATSNGSESIAIGDVASTSTAIRSIAIGNSATSNGNESIAIGDAATTSTHTNSVAIGNGATANTSNQIKIGNTLSAYQMDGRLNLVYSASSSLISYGSAIKMYRFLNGLTIGNYGEFAVNVADTTAEPTSVPTTRGGINCLYINANGRSYFGKSDNTEEIHLRSNLLGTFLDGYGNTNADLQIDSNNKIVKSSDRRLKENITHYDKPSIEKIMKLKPAYYTWKYDKSKNPHINLGFIAQEVEDIIPEAVDGKKYEFEWEKDEDGEPILDASGNLQFTDIPRYRGISDRPIIAVLVKAVQELKMEIEALKNP